MGEANVTEFSAAAQRSRDALEELLADTDRARHHPRGGPRRARRSAVARRRRRLQAGDRPTTMVEGMRHAARRGTAGWRDDDLAFMAPWGFDVTSIAAPVLVAYGGEDRMVPQQHGNWLAAHLPRHREVLAPDHGHLSLMSDPAWCSTSCSRSPEPAYPAADASAECTNTSPSPYVVSAQSWSVPSSWIDVDDDEVVAGHRGQGAGEVLQLLGDGLELGLGVVLGRGAGGLRPRHRVVERAGHGGLVGQRGAVEGARDREAAEPHAARVVEVAPVLAPAPAVQGQPLALGRVGLRHRAEAEARLALR